jgi:two-component system KDP operon response regulator KdpE
MKRRKIVLVVEDDAQLRHLYWQAMTFEGFHVVTAEDGLTALDCMRHTPPSVVVLDLNVPGVPGGEILREMAANSELQNIPVIVVSGSEEAADVAHQAAAFFRKPVPLYQVVEAIQKHVSAA